MLEATVDQIGERERRFVGGNVGGLTHGSAEEAELPGRLELEADRGVGPGAGESQQQRVAAPARPDPEPDDARALAEGPLAGTPAARSGAIRVVDGTLAFWPGPRTARALAEGL